MSKNLSPKKSSRLEILLNVPTGTCWPNYLLNTYLATSATQQKEVFLTNFFFVNWAGQMFADQTCPKKSNIKSYKFLTFSYFIDDVA